MKLFDYVGEALLRAETSKPKISREAFIWPSSASATLYDQTEAEYVGKCHRAEIFKMIGQPQTNPTDEVSARKFRMGRACEADIVKLCKDAGIFVAAGIRSFIPDINMTLELDLVVLDPQGNHLGVFNQGVIVENKSISGYYGVKMVMKEGHPKKDAVMQELVYLNEFRTGAIIKAAIKQGLEKQEKDGALVEKYTAQLDRENAAECPDLDKVELLEVRLAKAKYDFGRNRIEVDLDNFQKMDDGPLAGKLAYEARDTCQAREFDVAIWEDPVSGKHYPMIDGEPYQWFDIEDIYARWTTLKAHFNRIREEGIRLAAERGIKLPDEGADIRVVNAYWAEVGAIMQKLPKELLPAAEFEWKYTSEKIERMFSAGVLGKTKYNNWKKGAKGYDRLGDWHCLASGTPVELSNGLWIPIEEVSTTDVTTLGAIIGTSSKGADREMVELKPYNLLPLVLTFDHEVKLADGSWKPAAELVALRDTPKYQVRSTSDGVRSSYTKRDWVHEVVVPFDTSENSVDLSDEDLWIIGLWLAEGHFHGFNSKGEPFKSGFTINPNEEYAVERVKAWAHRFKRSYHGHPEDPVAVTDRFHWDARGGGRKYRQVIVNSAEASRFIARYAFGRSATTKCISYELMSATLRQQRILLEGAASGDGCRSKMRGAHMNVYASSSVQLASQVQRLIWRQGVVAGIFGQSDRSSGFNQDGTCYHVRWYDGPSWVSRIENGMFYTKIYKLTRDVEYMGLVYDLEIEGSHSIPTISGVVHNCSFCSFAAKCIPMEYPDMAYVVLQNLDEEGEAA